jgi:hypothetical protein
MINVSHPEFDIAVTTAVRLAREQYGCQLQLQVHHWTDSSGVDAGWSVECGDPDEWERVVKVSPIEPLGEDIGLLPVDLD